MYKKSSKPIVLYSFWEKSILAKISKKNTAPSSLADQIKIKLEIIEILKIIISGISILKRNLRLVSCSNMVMIRQDLVMIGS